MSSSSSMICLVSVQFSPYREFQQVKLFYRVPWKLTDFGVGLRWLRRGWVVGDPEWKHHPHQSPSATGNLIALVVLQVWTVAVTQRWFHRLLSFRPHRSWKAELTNRMFRVCFCPLEFLPASTMPSCGFRREESPPDVTRSICTGRLPLAIVIGESQCSGNKVKRCNSSLQYKAPTPVWTTWCKPYEIYPSALTFSPSFQGGGWSGFSFLTTTLLEREEHKWKCTITLINTFFT